MYLGLQIYLDIQKEKEWRNALNILMNYNPKYEIGDAVLHIRRRELGAGVVVNIKRLEFEYKVLQSAALYSDYKTWQTDKTIKPCTIPEYFNKL